MNSSSKEKISADKADLPDTEDPTNPRNQPAKETDPQLTQHSKQQ